MADTMNWQYYGWQKGACHTVIWSLGDDLDDGFTTIKVDHATRNVYAPVNDTWVDRHAQLMSELPWEQDGLPDACDYNVPLVHDNETRRLAKDALVAAVRRVRENPDERLYGLAHMLQAACACTYSLEDDYRRASFVGACFKHGYHKLLFPEWDAFGQHVFDLSMTWLQLPKTHVPDRALS